LERKDERNRQVSELSKSCLPVPAVAAAVVTALPSVNPVSLSPVKAPARIATITILEVAIRQTALKVTSSKWVVSILSKSAINTPVVNPESYACACKVTIPIVNIPGKALTAVVNDPGPAVAATDLNSTTWRLIPVASIPAIDRKTTTLALTAQHPAFCHSDR
jgi:hypothetical protein